MRLFRFVWLLALLPAMVGAQGTSAFTYQGRLDANGQPKTGTVDLRFDAYDAGAGGVPLNTQPVILDGVPLDQGVFAVQVNFGSAVFTGGPVFVEVGVREDAVGGAADISGFTSLLPRQQTTATPYSLHAERVAANAVTGAQIADGSATGADLADDSVGSADIADSSVTSADIADGSITAADADTSTAGSGLQRRLSGPCAAGQAINDIASSGVPACVPAVSAVTAAFDSGLTVTPNGASAALTIDATTTQRRVSGRCQYRRAAIAGVTEQGAVDCTYFDTPTPAAVVLLDSAGDVGSHLSVLRPSFVNDVSVAYYDTSNGGRLKFLRCPNETCSPAPAPITIDDPANDVGQFVSIALGSGLTPTIAYYDATAGDLKLAVCDNFACTGSVTIRIVDSDGDVGRHPEIVLAFGSFGIAYYDASNSRYKYARCNDATCSAPTITALSGVVSAAASSDIAVARDVFSDPPQFAVIANSGRLLLINCADSACVGFSTATIMSNNAMRPISMSVAGHATGRFSRWLAFRNAQPSASPIKFCGNLACDAGSTFVFGDTLTGTPIATALVARAQGLPLLLQSDTSTQLGARSFLDNITTAAARLNGTLGSGAMDAKAFPETFGGAPAAGGIGIVYYDPGNGDLLYVRCVRNDCSERWP